MTPWRLLRAGRLHRRAPLTVVGARRQRAAGARIPTREAAQDLLGRAESCGRLGVAAQGETGPGARRSSGVASSEVESRWLRVRKPRAPGAVWLGVGQRSSTISGRRRRRAHDRMVRRPVGPLHSRPSAGSAPTTCARRPAGPPHAGRLGAGRQAEVDQRPKALAIVLPGDLAPVLPVLWRSVSSRRVSDLPGRSGQRTRSATPAVRSSESASGKRAPCCGRWRSRRQDLRRYESCSG